MNGRCRAEEGAPHTLSACAGRSLVSRNRCVSWAASTLERPQVDVADHSVVMILQRLRDTAADAACADKVCAPLWPCNDSLSWQPAQRDTRAERRRAAANGRA